MTLFTFLLIGTAKSIKRARTNQPRIVSLANFRIKYIAPEIRIYLKDLTRRNFENYEQHFLISIHDFGKINAIGDLGSFTANRSFKKLLK